MGKQNERLKLLWEAAGVLLTTEDPDAMLQGVFAEIREPLGLDGYFSFMVTETGDALRLVSCAGVSEEAARSISWIEFGLTVSGTVARHRKPIVVAYVQDSTDPIMHVVQGYGIRAYACNPLLAGGELLGTLSFASRTRDYFEPEEIEFLETISQYVTAANERLRLIKQLRAEDRRKDEFLATLAHELRNPLAPIRNGLELIRLSGNNPETLDQARTMIERQVRQMVRLVDDLLDVSRISRNKLELRRECVDLAVIVRSAAETSRPLIEAAAHELHVSLPEEPVRLDADPVRLAQAFSNLLNNAAKYSEPGGHISLIAERREGEVVVRVKDTGIGIPAEKLAHIFDLFVQVDGSRDGPQGGLGIGLTLVRRLVEMHHGTVEAHSEGTGRGCEFVIRLPVAIPPESPQLPAPDGAPGGAAAPVPRRVLVVDDNRDAADSLAEILELLGHEVATAYNGLRAVEEVQAFRPELVLLDLGMPGLDGYDAARQIRQLPECGDVMLVALTGWGQEEHRRRSREAGFNDHMVKPVDLAALERLLAGL
jgi:signal transduction histidine kinase